MNKNNNNFFGINFSPLFFTTHEIFGHSIFTSLLSLSIIFSDSNEFSHHF